MFLLKCPLGFTALKFLKLVYFLKEKVSFLRYSFYLDRKYKLEKSQCKAPIPQMQ